jgi:hypothetical protein
VERAHFNLDPLVRIGELAVFGCLLYQLTAMSQDESLAGVFDPVVDLVYELSEDDLFKS